MALKEEEPQAAEEVVESEANVGKIPARWARPGFGKMGRSLRREVAVLRRLEEGLRLQRVAAQELAIACEKTAKEREPFFPAAEKVRRLREQKHRAGERVRGATDELRKILAETASESLRLSGLVPWTQDLTAMRAAVDEGVREPLRRKRR